MRVLLPAMLLLSLAACQPQPKVHDESWMKAQVDSIVGSRMEEINRQAEEDLDQRMSIVVRQKADSILAARQAGTRPDSTKSLEP